MPLNEGQTVQYTVTTTRVADGTVLYWKSTGNTTNSDIVGGNTGSVTITNNQGVFNVTTSADVNTDGTKTLGIALSTGSQSGPTVVSTANPIVVEDTSQAPSFRLYAFGGSQATGLNNTDIVSSPTQVGSGTTWNEIAVHNNGAIATKTDGTLWLWGDNNYGQLGLNDRVNRSSPTQVGTLTNWSKVAAGSIFRLAVRTDGTLWSWGFGSGLGLDINYQSSRSSPTQVGTNTNWKNVGSGPYASHVLATDTNNYLYAWGYNPYGQLGTNDRISRSSPVQVSQIGWYTGSLAATSTNSFVNGVGGGGTQIYLYAWGFNGTGELGLNDRVDRSSPTQVGGLDWKNVAAHQNHRMATKSNGTLWLWGQNSYGQLGLNSVSTSYRSSPVQVGTNTDWATIACGYQSNFAIKTNGTLWSWGGNSFGQAGRDDLISRSSPTQIGTNTNWNKIAVGAFTTLLTTSS